MDKERLLRECWATGLLTDQAYTTMVGSGYDISIINIIEAFVQYDEEFEAYTKENP